MKRLGYLRRAFLKGSGVIACLTDAYHNTAAYDDEDARRCRLATAAIEAGVEQIRLQLEAHDREFPGDNDNGETGPEHLEDARTAIRKFEHHLRQASAAARMPGPLPNIIVPIEYALELIGKRFPS